MFNMKTFLSEKNKNKDSKNLSKEMKRRYEYIFGTKF